MNLSVTHTLEYNYSDSVTLNPHYLYITPKPSINQQITWQNLQINPEPSLIINNVDQEGNNQKVCFFDISLTKFEVVSNFKIKSETFSPLNFIFYPFESINIPILYGGQMGEAAKYFFSTQNIDPIVKEFALQIAQEANFVTLDFLMLLIKKIHQQFLYENRIDGDPNLASDTLVSKKGSCRDFAVLMIDCCVSMGLLARFVSGYLYGANLHEHDLHAWVDVYLPGGGWRGFDPTEGRVVDHFYIALASSLQPIGLNPVRGTFRSENIVTSTLKTNIIINLDE